MPGGQHWQSAQLWIQLAVFQNRGAGDIFQTNFGGIQKELAVLPQFGWSWRHDRFCQIDDIPDELLGSAAKSKIKSLCRTEKVGHHREGGVFYLAEQQGRALAPMFTREQELSAWQRLLVAVT